MASVREPARFCACSDVYSKENKGFVQRTVTANGETYIEDIYCDEPSCEVVYRKLYNGTETDVGRAVALRTHPLWFELHEMRFSAIERITDNEEVGTVTFSKCVSWKRNGHWRMGVSTLGCGHSEVHGWTGSQVPVTKREDHLGGWRRGCPPCRLRRARQAVMYRAMPGEASEA